MSLRPPTTIKCQRERSGGAEEVTYRVESVYRSRQSRQSLEISEVKPPDSKRYNGCQIRSDEMEKGGVLSGPSSLKEEET